jgi:hypothetical protein
LLPTTGVPINSLKVLNVFFLLASGVAAGEALPSDGTIDDASCVAL